MDKQKRQRLFYKLQNRKDNGEIEVLAIQGDVSGHLVLMPIGNYLYIRHAEQSHSFLILEMGPDATEVDAYVDGSSYSGIDRTILICTTSQSGALTAKNIVRSAFEEMKKRLLADARERLINVRASNVDELIRNTAQKYFDEYLLNRAKEKAPK